MTNGESFVSVRDVLRVLFRRGRPILTVTIAATIICTVVVYLMPPTFEAANKVLVRRTLPDVEELSLSQDARQSSPIFRQLSQADVINTEIAIIKSRDLVIQVMDDMDLTRKRFDRVLGYRRHVRAAYKSVRGAMRSAVQEVKYFVGLATRPTAEEIAVRKHEALISDVSAALVVEQIPESDVVRVGFRCSDPALAAAFARSLCEHAISWHIEKLRPTGNLSFYVEQAEVARSAVENLEKEMAEARSSLNLIGADSRKALLVQHQLSAKARLNQIEARRFASDAGIAALEAQLVSEPAMITLSQETVANPVWQSVSMKAAELDLQRSETATKFSEAGRTMKDMDRALGGARDLVDRLDPRLEGKRVEGVNTVHQALRQSLSNLASERAALVAEGEVIKNQIAAFGVDLRALNERTYRVDELERQLKSRTTMYERCLRNAEIARVGEDRQRNRLANLGVIESAGMPLSPIKPRKWLYILLSAAGAMLLSICWSFAVELNDETVGNEMQLKEHLDSPVLGVLQRCT